MPSPPTSRTRALQTWLATIQRANACLANYDMWSDRGREFAAPEEVARMDAESADARRELAEAKPALEALVAATRVEAPAEMAAWIDANDAYLAPFADDFATAARAAWGEVRAGTRAYVDDTGGVTASTPDRVARYRELFGIDP